MSRLTNDLSAVRMLFGPGLLNLFNTALVYLTTLWLLVHLSPRLTLWALLPLPGAAGRARACSSRPDVQGQPRHRTSSSAPCRPRSGGSVGNRGHQALHARAGARGPFARLNDEYLARSLTLVRSRGTLTPLFAMLGGAGTLIVLWAGGREVIAGRLSVGGLVAFNAYLVLLSWPTIALGWIIGIWQRGLAAWIRVRGAALDGAADCRSAWQQTGADVPRARRRLRCATCRWSSTGAGCWSGVSFSLPAGATLVDCRPDRARARPRWSDAIVRLQEVAPGAISVGGHDVTRIPLATLRGRVGYAPQDAFLFSATVAENIGFGISRSRGPDLRRSGFARRRRRLAGARHRQPARRV